MRTERRLRERPHVPTGRRPARLHVPRDARRRPGRTTFVFAGGAALGSIQVGMLRTLLGASRVLERHLPIARIEDAAIPLHVVAADTATRAKVVLSSGDAVSALLASTAVPGLYPPVRIDGRLLVDGGLAEDPPLGTAVERGASTVYLLPVGWPLGPAPQRNALVRAMDALDWLVWSVASAQLERWAPECDLYVVPSPPITALQPLSTRRARRLMAAAERMSRDWLPTARPWPDARVAAGSAAGS
jgi:NTE family protein